MDSNRFERYSDQILLQLELNSVIVMDNSAYHSPKLENVPSMSSRKDVIQERLTQMHLPCDQYIHKGELTSIVQFVKDFYTKYKMDIAVDI